MTINVGTDVHGFIERRDGQCTYIAGTVVVRHAFPYEASVTIECAFTGAHLITYLTYLEPIAPRAADTFNYELADGSTVEHAFPRLEPLAPVE